MDPQFWTAFGASLLAGVVTASAFIHSSTA